MHKDTGEIKPFDEIHKKDLSYYAPIKYSDMTETQKKEMKVRKNDHRSPLAKQLDAIRNAPCDCGSGRKYKRCCMRKDLCKCGSGKLYKKCCMLKQVDRTKEINRRIDSELKKLGDKEES